MKQIKHFEGQLGGWQWSLSREAKGLKRRAGWLQQKLSPILSSAACALGEFLLGYFSTLLIAVGVVVLSLYLASFVSR